MTAKPSPLLRPGMDFVAGELEQQNQRNSDLVQKNQELTEQVCSLTLKLQKIEQILKSDF